ncbi:MAG: hypothetical protein NC342_03515 [Pseudoflavonifractor sp.]|nr:hypothetical protein [Alloprevotella sp.]MCM1116584.1 hypothetical protein [Pseudoflavonifractor sp.]
MGPHLSRAKCLFWLPMLLAALFQASHAQAQMRAGQVDLFVGLDFNYRDVFHNDRVYDVMVRLTPGIKWRLPHRFELAAAAYIPVINQYGPAYRNPGIYVASLSWQTAIGNRLRLKASGGVFSWERYGLDLKTLTIINPWLAFSAEAGLTGHLNVSDGWNCSPMERLTFLAGPEVWLSRWTTQMWVKAGRFVYGDYGVKAEAYRHFKHVSVGIWASYSQQVKENAGFNIIVMLPPYKRSRHKVNLRPAADFQLGYRMEANPYSTRQYVTDPEQNVRSGWADPDLLPWGPDTMKPDFVYRNEKNDSIKAK